MAETVRRWIHDRMLAIAFSLGFAAIGVALAASLWNDAKTPVLRLSAGPEVTRRHALADYLCDEAERNDLSIDLTSTAGTEACLHLLKSGRLDAAIVSTGVVVPDDDDICIIGALQLEAVHVLVRRELAEAGPLSQAVRGKRVNLGDRGSAERLLVSEFLAFAGLKLPTASRPGDIVPTEFSREEVVRRCKAVLSASGAERKALMAELPDCLLVLDTMPSTVAQLLIEAADFQIKSLPATRAFLLDKLQDRLGQATILEREFLEPTVIPAHSYFATQSFPATDCETVGLRLLVVARQQAPVRAIRALTKTLFEGEFAQRLRPDLPNTLASPYAIHPVAAAYLDRDKPLLAINKAMEWFSTGLSIFGAFSAGALSLYSLLRRRKARTPSQYFAEIRKLEGAHLVSGMEASAELPPPEVVKHLDNCLLKLRHDLIDDICGGRIKGDQVIANILLLLRDARGNLPHFDEKPAEPGEFVVRQPLPTRKAA